MGGESPQDLQKCRQVCQGWNVMVSQMTKYEKDTVRRKAESLAESLAERIPRRHPVLMTTSFLPEITTAASLAHYGMLDSVESLYLWNVDLASIPAEHLASLVSCVTECVDIINVSNCDIVTILDNIKCEQLRIERQTLSSEETRALVRAMESHVEVVQLGCRGEVSLDMAALTQYSGQGKCRRVTCWSATADRYREEVRSWAKRISWRATDHQTLHCLNIHNNLLE